MWPDGPVCPHCGVQEARGLKGKAHRPGLYQCNACRQQFTVTVGTLFERSKIPLTKWLMAMYLLSASKKSMSTNQLSRMLGLPYKTAWFMTHRIREATRDLTDMERAILAAKSIQGKRLTYRRTDEARYA